MDDSAITTVLSLFNTGESEADTLNGIFEDLKSPTPRLDGP
jgi:hypothetical protein